MRNWLPATAVGVLLLCASPAYAVNTVASSDATALANALAGLGVTVTSSTLTTNAENGFFSNGLAATGISSGVVLTNGGLSCIGSVNTVGNCTGGPSGASTSSLAINFKATSSSLFFNYVFGSEEYNEYVGTQFNDAFSLILNGANYTNVNLAQIPGGGGPVTINNVNSTSNAAYYNNNSGPGSLNLPIELDGLTKVLTASATDLVIGATYSLTFNIADAGDTAYDSAVFIQAGSVGTTTPPVETSVPEPSVWAMMMLGLGLMGAALRRRTMGATLRFA